MKTNSLNTSAKMAFALGVFLPLAETARRFNQLLDPAAFLSWFDDYILGALLLIAARFVFKRKKNAGSYLLVVWVIATIGIARSFVGQFRYYKTSSGDPGIFPTTLVTAAKGLLLLYVLVGLYKALPAKANPELGNSDRSDLEK
jgi:uncharacterized membrane-anchored protein